MNNGMKRILKYMTVYAQRLMLFFIGFIVIWTLYMGLIIGGFSNDSIDAMLSSLPTSFIGLGAMLQLIFTMGYIPLLSNGQLSMGATRKEVVAGIAYAHLLVSIEVIIISLIVKLTCGSDMAMTNVGYVMLCGGIFLFVAGLGIIVAVLIEKFGKVAYIIMVVLVALCAGAMGGIIAANRNNLPEIIMNESYTWMALIVGAVAYVLSVVIYGAISKNKAVKV